MTAIHNGNTKSEKPAVRFRALLLFALCVALLLMLYDIVDGFNVMSDIDDDLRAIQIRLLVEGQSWFDRTIPMIQMPEAYVSPWSRLVDMPYAAIAWILTPALGIDMAPQAAFWIWPPAMLVMLWALLVRTQLLMLDGIAPLRPITLVCCVLLMMPALHEFVPGRIDHHNVQLLLFMLAFLGLGLWTPFGAVLTGISTVASVAVGLELLPLSALLLAAVSLCWMLDRPGSRAFAISLGLSILASTPLLGLALLGPAGLASTQCDAFSAPYAIALAGYGAITVGLAIAPIRIRVIGRGVLLAASGAALMGWLAWRFPLCLEGPYQIIDPLTRSLWFERIEQEKSFLVYYEHGLIAGLIGLGAFVVILAVAAPIVLKTLKMGRSGTSIIYLSAIAASVLALVQIRYLRFAAGFVPLFVPYALIMVARGKSAGRWLLAVVVMVVVIGFGLEALDPAHSRDIDVADYLTDAACLYPDFSVLSRVQPGRILMPPTQALHMMVQLPPRMSVAAVSFHRSAPGMRRVLQVFISPDSESRRKAAEDFDYIAVCRLPIPAAIADDTLFAVLSRGGGWPGLERLSGADDAFQLFRIDHTAFR
ncbi:hypothetical protein OEG84_09350 [Hoeflea sp. G2-23]|uniref:Glycosyltransferase RgtA/B/C/D-like domain-containing protein n=1 Tax=Hoeflea algicola TaxID=2983763 RepID=A0ABT3Z809_9HYPH|nr:hypothetical protein [Hoeflea algicola]MCY0147912.1 hypothetical protein [Hoeflea algicola]